MTLDVFFSSVDNVNLLTQTPVCQHKYTDTNIHTQRCTHSNTGNKENSTRFCLQTIDIPYVNGKRMATRMR